MLSNAVKTGVKELVQNLPTRALDSYLKKPAKSVRGTFNSRMGIAEEFGRIHLAGTKIDPTKHTNRFSLKQNERIRKTMISFLDSNGQKPEMSWAKKQILKIASKVESGKLRLLG